MATSSTASLDQYAAPTADDATPLHFTGKERDTESGNDYFGARYYASAMGRFIVPGLGCQEEPVPYANLDDPQTPESICLCSQQSAGRSRSGWAL